MDIPEVVVEANRTEICKHCGKPKIFGFRRVAGEGEFSWSCGSMTCMIKDRDASK